MDASFWLKRGAWALGLLMLLSVLGFWRFGFFLAALLVVGTAIDASSYDRRKRKQAEKDMEEPPDRITPLP